MQENKTTLQVVSSNPNLIIENNFADTFDESGKVVKELKYLSTKFKIKDFYGDGFVTWILTEDGELWGCGDNGADQQGWAATNDTSRRRILTRIATNATQLFAVRNQTFYINDKNELWGSGAARGLASSKFSRRATDVKFVTTSVTNTFLIKTNGDVYACGYQYLGGAGNGVNTQQSNLSLSKILDGSLGITQLCTCDSTSFYIDGNNDLYVVGGHRNGAAGLGSTSNNKGVLTWTKVGSNVKKVCTGGHATWYLTYDGELYSTGIANIQADGQQAANRSRFALCQTGVRDIYLVPDTSYPNPIGMFITNNDDLYIVGSTTSYADGSGKAGTIKHTVPTKIASNVKVAKGGAEGIWYMDNNNNLYASGGYSNYCSMSIFEQNVHQVTKFTDMCPKSNVWSLDGEKVNLADYGLSITGTPALNDTLTLTFNTKVLVPPLQTRLNVETSNNNLQIKNNYSGTKEKTGIVHANLTYGLAYDKIKSVKVADQHICYVDSSNDLYLRGQFEYGSGGDNSAEAITHTDTKIASNVIKVGGDNTNTFYINDKKELYVSGQNSFGQLGLNTTEAILTFTKIADNIKDALLNDCLMYVNTDGDLYVCGRNDLGQLGINSVANLNTPQLAAYNVDYISSNGQSCWYVSKGELYGAGNNTSGEQGSGDNQNVLLFTKRADNVKVVCAGYDNVQYITEDGDLYGSGKAINNKLFNGSNEDVNYTEFIKTNSGIKDLYLGPRVNYYIKDNNELYVIGDNHYGEYGDGNSIPDNDADGSNPVKVADNVMSVGYCHYYDNEGHLFLCAHNTYGQIQSAPQTYSLKARNVVANTNLPWTDITQQEEGWADENQSLVDLNNIGVEIEGEPQYGDTIALTFNTRRLVPVGLTLEHGDHRGFRFVTTEQYEMLLKEELVTGNIIYAITDANVLLLGNKPYSINNKFVEEYPEHPSQGVIYFNTKTQGVKMYNGAEWVFIVPDIESSLTQETLDENLLTAKAIRDYIDPVINDQLIHDVTFNVDTNIFTVIQIDGQTRELALRNILSGITYNQGVFIFNKLGTDDVVITTPEENYLVEASFDGRVITMILKDGAKITVDLLDLIDIYLGNETSTAKVTIENQEIQIEAKLSLQEGNAIVDLDGLYVPDHLIKSVKSTELTEVAYNDMLTVDVKISAQEGNTLRLNEDGLFTDKVDIEKYYDKEDMDIELNEEKDKEEFNLEIDLKIEPDKVYEKELLYTQIEVNNDKAWRSL